MSARATWLVALGASVGLLVGALFATWSPSDGADAPATLETGTATAGAQAIGPGGPPLSFHPLVPCRAFDTRLAGGRLQPGAPRTLLVRGADGFPGQGGRAGGCDVPESAVAVDVNLTGVNPDQGGFLRAWPTGEDPPEATVLNFSTSLDASNAVTLPLCDREAGPCPSDVTVRAFRGTTHLVGDVVGYFEGGLFAVVEADGTLARGSRVDEVQHTGETGEYRVNFDRDLSGCAFEATLGRPGTGVVDPGLVDVALNSLDSSGVFVRTHDPDGAALSDEAFHLVVSC